VIRSGRIHIAWRKNSLTRNEISGPVNVGAKGVDSSDSDDPSANNCQRESTDDRNEVDKSAPDHPAQKTQISTIVDHNGVKI
jgi:hypothetical protein